MTEPSMTQGAGPLVFGRTLGDLALLESLGLNPPGMPWVGYTGPQRRRTRSSASNGTLRLGEVLRG